jgi:hypothetical protein
MRLDTQTQILAMQRETETRIQAMQQDTQAQFKAMQQDTQAQFQAMSNKIDRVATSLEVQAAQLQTVFSALEVQSVQHQAAFSSLNDKIDSVEKRLDGKIEMLLWVIGVAATLVSLLIGFQQLKLAQGTAPTTEIINQLDRAPDAYSPP